MASRESGFTRALNSLNQLKDECDRNANSDNIYSVWIRISACLHASLNCWRPYPVIDLHLIFKWVWKLLYRDNYQRLLGFKTLTLSLFATGRSSVTEDSIVFGRAIRNSCIHLTRWEQGGIENGTLPHATICVDSSSGDSAGYLLTLCGRWVVI